MCCERWGGGLLLCMDLGPPLPRLPQPVYSNRIIGRPVDIPNLSLVSGSCWLQLIASIGQPASTARPHPHLRPCEHQETGKREAKGHGAGGKSLPKPFPPHASPQLLPLPHQAAKGESLMPSSSPIPNGSFTTRSLSFLFCPMRGA